MAWKLTNPLNGGDISNDTYAEIRIEVQQNNSSQKRMSLVLQYGNTVGGVWMVAELQPTKWPTQITIGMPDYQAMIEAAAPKVVGVDPEDPTYVEVGADGKIVWVERTYNAVRRGLYEWCAAGGFIPPGVLK